MLLATIIAITFFIIGLLLAFQGLWVFSRALWPSRVQASAARCRRSALASFLTGLPITCGVILLSAVVSRTGGAPGQLVGFAVASIWFLYANVGISGLATHIGQRLVSPADADQPWRATLRGGLALELAWLFPIAGWLGLMPLSLILGTGAVTLSFFRPRIDTPSVSASMPYAAPFSAPVANDPYAAGIHGRGAHLEPLEPVESVQ